MNTLVALVCVLSISFCTVRMPGSDRLFYELLLYDAVWADICYSGPNAPTSFASPTRVLAYMLDHYRLGSTGTATATTFGAAVSGGGKYEGIAMSPATGTLVTARFTAAVQSYLEINPNGPSYTQFGSVGAGIRSSMVATPSGLLYELPQTDTNIYEIDVATHSIRTYSNATGVQCGGGGYNPLTGKVYCAPVAGVSSVLEFDPATKTFSSIGSVTGAHIGMALALNGKMYTFPINTNQVAEIDVQARTVTHFGANYTSYAASVLGPDGHIYAISTAGGPILEIDPNSRTATTWGSLLATQAIALAPNGRLYALPATGTVYYEIDVFNRSISSFGSASGASNFNGAATAYNGKIYGAPFAGTGNLQAPVEVDSRAVSNFCPAFVSSPLLNRSL